MQIAFVSGLSPAGIHRFAVHLWGKDGNTRPPVICVHGLLRNGRDFDELAQALSDTRPVACPDVVGRGRSDWLRDPSHYGLPQYLQDMMSVLSLVGDGPVDWVGTSMGGLIGMVLAAQPGSPIRRLVLNDVGPFISAEALTQIASLVGDPVFPDRAALRQNLSDALADWGDVPPGALDRLTEFGGRRRPDGTWGRSYDPAIAAPMPNPATDDVDLWPLWQAISCPALVLRGERSQVLTADTAGRMAERPGVEVIEIADCGHAPSLMLDDQIQRVRSWLDD